MKFNQDKYKNYIPLLVSLLLLFFTIVFLFFQVNKKNKSSVSYRPIIIYSNGVNNKNSTNESNSLPDSEVKSSDSNTLKPNQSEDDNSFDDSLNNSEVKDFIDSDISGKDIPDSISYLKINPNSLDSLPKTTDYTINNQTGDIIYSIKENDTLSKISSLFGISVDELANYNQIRDVDLIYQDSSLKLPQK